jgi:hypothetical protein
MVVPGNIGRPVVFVCQCHIGAKGNEKEDGAFSVENLFEVDSSTAKRL